ncbi:MAG: cadherin-like domain-containing protein, partial [Myxococcales bacterium]|nr:cadherin-like domain-containing protein [Myxococcales bacterium]
DAAPPTSFLEDQEVSFVISATDEDTADTLVFSVSGDSSLPSWLELTSNPNRTATLSGTPGDSDLTAGVQVSFTVSDGNGGTDELTVTISVTNVNDDPTAVDDEYDNVFGNTQFSGSSVLLNDFDVDPTNDILSVQAQVGSSSGGGTFNIAADGTFTYVSAPGYRSETDTFTYTLTDGNGGTATGTVTLNTGQVIWYVDNRATAGANLGTETNPFVQLSSVDAASIAGDWIYLYGANPNYYSGLSLKANQRLIGVPVTGAKPIIDGTIAVAAGVELSSLAFELSSSSAVNGSATGVVTLSDLEIAGTIPANVFAIDLGTVSQLNAELITIDLTSGSGIRAVNQVDGSTGSFEQIDVASDLGSCFDAYDFTTLTLSADEGMNNLSCDGDMFVLNLEHIDDLDASFNEVAGATQATGMSLLDLSGALTIDTGSIEEPGLGVSIDTTTALTFIYNGGIDGSTVQLADIKGIDADSSISFQSGTVDASSGIGIVVTGLAGELNFSDISMGSLTRLSGLGVSVQGTGTFKANQITARTAGTGFSASGVALDVSLASVDSTVQGLELSNTSGNYQGASLVSSGGNYNVEITNHDGEVNIGSVELSAPTIGSLLLENGGTVTFSAGTIFASGPWGMTISDTAGALTFSQVHAHAADSVAPIEITDFDGSIDFGQVSIATQNATAVDSLRGGDLTFSGGVISSSGALRGISIVDGSLSGEVDSVTISECQVGIYMENVDNPSGFSVSGGDTPSRPSGGAIQSVTNRGVELHNVSDVSFVAMDFLNANTTDGSSCGSVRNGNNRDCNGALYIADSGDVSLSDVMIQNTAQSAIVATAVDNLTLDFVTITNSGDEVGEHAVRVLEPTTSVTMNSTTITGSAENGFTLHASQTPDLSVTLWQSSLSSSAGSAGSGVLLTSASNAQISLLLDGSTFDGNPSSGVTVNAEGNSIVNVEAKGDTFFDNSQVGLNLAVANTAGMAFDIHDGPVFGPNLSIVGLNLFTSKTGFSPDLTGFVESVTFYCTGENGIRIIAQGNGQVTAQISYVTASAAAFEGIYADLRNETLTGPLASIDLTLTGSDTSGSNTGALFYADSGDLGTFCLDASGNNLGTTSLNQAAPTTFSLAGYPGGDVATFLQGQNTASVSSAGTFVSASNCATAVFPYPAN